MFLRQSPQITSRTIELSDRRSTIVSLFVFNYYVAIIVQDGQKVTETSSKLARLTGGIVDLVGKILVPALLVLLIIVYAVL